jgi:hypothetical protein
MDHASRSEPNALVDSLDNSSGLHGGRESQGIDSRLDAGRPDLPPGYNTKVPPVHVSLPRTLCFSARLGEEQHSDESPGSSVVVR